MTSFNTSIITSNSVSHISFQSVNRKTIIIAWYIHEFILIDHSSTRILSQKIIQIVIVFVFINFRFAKFSTIRNIKTSTKSIVYSFEWITITSIFRKTVLQFYQNIENYRQTFVFRSFVNRRSSFIESSEISNSTSERHFFIFERQTSSIFSIFRLAKRFYQINDISISEKNQSIVNLSMKSSIFRSFVRTFSYSFIIDSDHRFTIDSQQIDDNQSINSNSITTRETSIEKIIYEQSIKSTSSNNMIDIDDNIDNVVIDFVVQTAIDNSMQNMMNTMLDRMQQMINDQQNVIEFAKSTEQSKQSEQSKQLKSSESVDFVDDNIVDDFNRFVVKKLKFFDFNYDDKSTSIDASLENINENTIFRDVHVFVNRIKNFVNTQNVELIRDNLYRCLKKDALIWHISLLTNMKKRLLTMNIELIEWKNALMTEFRKSIFKIMKAFVTKRYIMQNAFNQRLFRDYVQFVIRLNKSIELSLFNQLLQIWNDFDSNFQLHVTKFIHVIKMNDFFRELNDKKNSWWKFVVNQFNSSRHDESQKNKNKQKRERFQQRDMLNVNRNRNYQFDNYQRFYQFEFQQTFVSIDFQNFFNQFQTFNQYQNRAYQNRQQQKNQYSNASSQQLTLSVSLSLKQITESSNRNVASNAFDFYQQSSSQQQRQIFRSFDFNRQRTTKVFYSTNQENQSFEIEKIFFEKLWQAYQIDETNAHLDQTNVHYDDDDYFDDEFSEDINESKNQNSLQFEITQINYINQSITVIISDEMSTIIVDERVFTCRRCNENFYSNNKLHKHVKQCRVDSVVNFNASKNVFVIESIVNKEHNKNYDFRSWHYVCIHVNISSELSTDEFCLDSDIIMSIENKRYILNRLSKIFVFRISESIRIRDIDTIWHDIFEYVMIDFYIFEVTIADTFVKAHFTREIHLIDSLSVKILIEMNVIISKKMIINVDKQIVTIDSCDVTTKLHVISRDKRMNRVVKFLKQLIIFSHIHMIVFVKIREQTLSTNRDYFFHSLEDSRLETENDFFAHIIDVNFIVVQVRNSTNQSITISRNFKLNKLNDYNEKNCFLVASKNRHLVVKSSGWLGKTLSKTIEVACHLSWQTSESSRQILKAINHIFAYSHDCIRQNSRTNTINKSWLFFSFIRK